MRTACTGDLYGAAGVSLACRNQGNTSFSRVQIFRGGTVKAHLMELYKVTNVKGAVDCGFGLRIKWPFHLGASKLLNPDGDILRLLSHADELPECFAGSWG